MLFLPRSWWDAPSGEPFVAAGRRERVVFHHSVAIDDDETPNEWEEMEEIRAFMHRLQGMRPDLFPGRRPEVPYNAVAFLPPRHRSIHSALVLVEGIGMDRRGAHAERANTPSVGICFAGDFTEYDGKTRLSCAIAEILGWLDSFYGRKLPVVGHRDLKATECPGGALYAALGPYMEGGDRA